jgi:hypothetical protein
VTPEGLDDQGGIGESHTLEGFSILTDGIDHRTVSL